MRRVEPPSSRPAVWIVNPYGTVPGESWATYRSTMLAECLADHGYAVTQFMSNFEHRSKTFRSPGHAVLSIRDGYDIEIIPSTPYDRHISARRIRYERAFAGALVERLRGRQRPAFVILAEPALFYYDLLLRPMLGGGGTALVLDVIDIWPELFELVFPRRLRPLSTAALAPLHYWRRRLYARASGVAAVSHDYAELARRLVGRSDVPIEVVYWGFTEEHAAPGTAVDPAVERLVAGKRTGEVWAVYAGTLGANYDIPAVIDAARRFAATGPPQVRVIVCGDGPLAGHCRSAADAHLVFLGRLRPADLQHLYGHCDVALSTYRGESTVAMPIKAFDYLRFGLPMVNSLGRDIGRLVAERNIGVNYDASAPGALFDAIAGLARDADLRAVMAANARALAAEFSAERQYPKFVSLLERIRTPS